MATSVSTAGAESDRIPAEVRESLSGVAMAAAGANVIMQLALLPVGRGVAESRVDSGRVDKHPIKRARTTLSYLMIALLGTPEEQEAMRREVDRQHRQVRSLPDDDVSYNAFDRDLQLWVAACLYRGIEDVHRILHGELEGERREIIYRHAARLGTTLQVREEQWPADRDAFQEYWDQMVATIEMDDVTRRYLLGIADASFFGPPFTWVISPMNRFFTAGFLPPEFRDELGLSWSPREQRRFDRVMGLVAGVDRMLPRPVREFPLNIYLWDVRRRIRTGKPIV
ncbi:oxygenase MpaB family protein [Actinospongicola halichondriae]|uniref:oxygenase MpaB family protein n=1 Tax=Actinospongicola halichondriae TaxID=3236844 RepID=UPI003D5A4F24